MSGIRVAQRSTATQTPAKPADPPLSLREISILRVAQRYARLELRCRQALRHCIWLLELERDRKARNRCNSGSFHNGNRSVAELGEQFREEVAA